MRSKPLYQSRWLYLTFSLIFLLFIYPYSTPKSPGEYSWFLQLLNNITVLVIIYSAGVKPHRALVGLLFAIPALILPWFIIDSSTIIVILLSNTLLYLYAIALTVHFLFTTKKVSVNEVFATVSLYLLLGLIWTTFYLELEFMIPGSFYLTSESVHTLDWATLLYYSFVTLTTLGYGDITPVTAPARSLAIIEAIIGILFIPLIISSSLSIYLTQKIASEKGAQRSPEKR